MEAKNCASSTAFRLKARLGHARLDYASGFTLMELMIALALGLLIVAAGLAVVLSSQRSLGLQSGMGELQQNANFGLSLITHDLRHTNLNMASEQRVNSYTTGSGIIFKKENLPEVLRTTTNLETKFVTLQEHNIGNTTESNDQLTIQYMPSTNHIFNCEGVDIATASSKTIVQRYYLAESPQQVTGEPTAYSLYCDAGYYESGATTIIGLDTNAQQMMQRVDAFKVRLGVKNPAGNLRYMTINEYTTAMNTILNAASCSDKTASTCTSTFLNVISIDVGILSRSTGTIGSEVNLNTQNTFGLAGANVTLSGDAVVNKRYLRQAVNQVVAIRNTLGASE